VKPRITALHKQIGEALAKYGDMSIYGIHIMTGIPEKTVCPRLKELRDNGLVRHKGYAINENGKRVMLWGF